MMKKLEDYVITIPDFPQPGIMFRDITGILQDADGFRLSIDTLVDMVKDLDFDVIVGAESRGFIFGAPMADRLHKPFVLARKKGKLPRETVEVEYALEYGTAILQMHKDAVKAITQLVEQLGGEVVRLCFVLELAGLNGRKVLEGYDVRSAICYEGK